MRGLIEYLAATGTSCHPLCVFMCTRVHTHVHRNTCTRVYFRQRVHPSQARGGEARIRASPGPSCLLPRGRGVSIGPAEQGQRERGVSLSSFCIVSINVDSHFPGERVTKRSGTSFLTVFKDM